jgi:hypothetical protein
MKERRKAKDAKRIEVQQLAAPLQSALGFYEAFRRLGFAADDVHLVINGPLREPIEHAGKTQIVITLMTQGRVFNADCGVIDETPMRVAQAWGAIAMAMKSGDVDVGALERVFKGSVAYTHSVMFLMALKSHGFVLPKELN